MIYLIRLFCRPQCVNRLVKIWAWLVHAKGFIESDLFQDQWTIILWLFVDVTIVMVYLHGYPCPVNLIFAWMAYASRATYKCTFWILRMRPWLLSFCMTLRITWHWWQMTRSLTGDEKALGSHFVFEKSEVPIYYRVSCMRYKKLVHYEWEWLIMLS